MAAIGTVDDARDQYGRALSAFFEARAVVVERIDQAGYATDDELATLCEARVQLDWARREYLDLLH
jgi:hypothetical protein